MLHVVPCTPSGIRACVSVTSPIRHLCPFKDEIDDGFVTITWSVSAGQTLELHSLCEYLDSFEGIEVSHEDITAWIMDAISSAGMSGVRVSTSWVTAGMDVTVIRGDESA